jgi:hypothetical protein
MKAGASSLAGKGEEFAIVASAKRSRAAQDKGDSIKRAKGKLRTPLA